MSATELRDQVLRELRFDQRIDSSKIGVIATDDGIVTLSGAVPSYTDRVGAEAAARRVRSVKAVANDVDVRLPGDITHTDTDIAQRAIDSLRWRSGMGHAGR
jgi:osmotically-inducible protein OsmY